MIADAVQETVRLAPRSRGLKPAVQRRGREIDVAAAAAMVSETPEMVHAGRPAVTPGTAHRDFRQDRGRVARIAQSQVTGKTTPRNLTR